VKTVNRRRRFEFPAGAKSRVPLLRLICLALVLLCANGRPASGQIAPEFSDVTIGPALAELVRQLDDPSFTLREEAMGRLMQASADQSVLYAMLSRDDLSAEQQQRLLEAVRQKLLRRPRGALGISMPTTRTAPRQAEGIEVGSLLRGMPAEKVLEVGDVITHIDGRPVRGIEELQSLVQEKRPGDDVLLTVKRPQRDEEGRFITDEDGLTSYETLEKTVSLASADDLDQPTSRLVLESPVLIARRRESLEAARRFIPLVQYVGVRDLPGSPVTDDEVERHPLVQRILSQRRALSEFGVQPGKALREQWGAQERRLRELMQRPDLTPRQRQFHKRVYERYKTLILP
jgi:hypothetical protein